MKAKTVCLLALLGVMACGCGKEPPEEPVEMGRYAETWMELPKTGEKYVGLV